MITVNVIDSRIVGSIGEEPFAVEFDKELYVSLQKLSEEAAAETDMEKMQALFDTADSLLKDDFGKVIETECKYIKASPSTKEFFLHFNGVTSNIAMPKELTDRIFDSHDKGVDYMPLVRMWVRFLRNPLLAKKGAKFGRKFFRFVNIKYVHPKLMEEFTKKGFNSDVAKERATMYQMKITNEGLLNGYKVSREVEIKFGADEEGNRVTKNRYTRTFDADTGEVSSEGKPDSVEERLFEPAVMGKTGDAFSCEGVNGYLKPGHFIKVGCVHALDSWDQVNTDDNKSCVKGLHIGGLNYISGISGEIHNIFVDPMHVGAVPNDDSGVIRCKQYFVHSSLAGVNGSIYHSSTYAKTVDGEWDEMCKEAVKVRLESEKEASEEEARKTSLK